MSEVIELITSISSIVEFIILLIACVTCFNIKRIKQFLVKVKLKKVLALKKTDCEIILPVREGILNEKNRDGYLGPMRVDYKYITFEESSTLLFTQSLLHMAGYNKTMVPINPNMGDVTSNCNKFCYGGPLANEYVRDIFRINGGGIFQFKQPFLFGCTEESYYHPGYDRLRELKKIDNKYNGKVLFYGDKEFTYENDYVVLIRIHADDFQNSAKGTVHIGFGYSAKATCAAASCFTNETEVLYKKLKMHKKHYFIIIKYTPNGELDFSKDSFVDITKVMFGSE